MLDESSGAVCPVDSEHVAGALQPDATLRHPCVLTLLFIFAQHIFYNFENVTGSIQTILAGKVMFGEETHGFVF